MDGALDGIVAPPSQQIPGVDHNGILNRRRIDELPIGTLHLQPTARVLEQQGDGAIVSMLACADLAGVDLEHLALHGGVVQQAQGVVADVDEAVKVVGVDAHADGDGTHHFDVQRLALVEKVGHGALEPYDLVFFHRPWVGVAWLVFAADLIAFLDIGSG